MAKLEWGKIDDRFFQQGLDRGVAYVAGSAPVAWNGLTGFEEGGEPGETTILWRDGRMYLAEKAASDFTGTLTALAYPRAMGKALGMPEVTPGFIIDNQRPQPFGLTYRTLVGNGGTEDPFGFQIHLVYNAVASMAPRSRQSINDSVNLVEFSFGIICKPVKLPGYRPAAHYVIDGRYIPNYLMNGLQDKLYGTASTAPTLPTPGELKTYFETA